MNLAMKKKGALKKRLAQAKSSDIYYSLSRINLRKNFIEPSSSPIYNNLLNLNFGIEVDVNLITDTSVIQIIVKYRFSSDRSALLDMEVENDYKVQNFVSIVKQGKVTNQEFLIFLVELSIGHARGIQATIIKDTPIESYYIPYIEESKILEKINAPVFHP